jgi:hypothetical protein
MKNALLIFVGVMIGLGLMLLVDRKDKVKASTIHSNIVTAPVAQIKSKPPVSVMDHLPKVSEWQEFHSDRESALKNNPKLASEYKRLMADLGQQQKGLETAMLKTDPKLVPMLAKLEALRLHNSGTVGAASHGAKPMPVNNSPLPTLTAADWQELRMARAQALQANPDLMDQSKKFQGKIRAFEDELDSIMVKSDPNVAPLIAKFDTMRHSPVVSPNPTVKDGHVRPSESAVTNPEG